MTLSATTKMPEVPYSENAKVTSFDKGLAGGAASIFALCTVGLAVSTLSGALPAVFAFGAAAGASVVSAAGGMFYSHTKQVKNDEATAKHQRDHITRTSPRHVALGAAVPLIASVAVGCATAFWAASKFHDTVTAADQAPVSLSQNTPAKTPAKTPARLVV